MTRLEVHSTDTLKVRICSAEEEHQRMHTKHTSWQSPNDMVYKTSSTHSKHGAPSTTTLCEAAVAPLAESHQNVRLKYT